MLKTETSMVARHGRHPPQLRERKRLLGTKPSHNVLQFASSVEKKAIGQQSAKQTAPSRKGKQFREEKQQGHNPGQRRRL